jgi:hypothetical protein
MVEKCGNPACSEAFDCRRGRLYCGHMYLLNGGLRANNHGDERYWLCASCSNAFSFGPQAGFGDRSSHLS